MKTETEEKFHEFIKRLRSNELLRLENEFRPEDVDFMEMVQVKLVSWSRLPKDSLAPNELELLKELPTLNKFLQ